MKHCSIKITDNYFLRSDSGQWIISRFGGLDNKDNEKWDNLSFHVTPKNAIDSLSCRLLRESGATSLPELVEASMVIHDIAKQAYMSVLQAQDNLTLKVSIQ